MTQIKRIFSETHESLNTNEYFFEHELNELNEFFIKTCDSKIIRVIRIIRVQKNISGLYMLGVVLWTRIARIKRIFHVRFMWTKNIRVIREIRVQK